MIKSALSNLGVHHLASLDDALVTSAVYDTYVFSQRPILSFTNSLILF